MQQLTLNTPLFKLSSPHRRMQLSGLCETLNIMTVIQTHREAGLTENEVLARVEEDTGDIVVVTTTGVHLPCLGV